MASSRGATSSSPWLARRWRTTAPCAFGTVFDARQVGDTVRFTLWRDGASRELAATARRIARYDRLRHRYDQPPRYVVYAGLVFMPLEADLLELLGRHWAQTANRDLVWDQLFREAERPEEADRETVVLTRILRHPVNSQMGFRGPVGVERINDVAIRSLEDVVRAFSSNHERFHRIVFEGDAGIEALDREQAEAAQEEILRQYGIPSDRKL
jgi:hypothetical protein